MCPSFATCADRSRCRNGPWRRGRIGTRQLGMIGNGTGSSGVVILGGTPALPVAGFEKPFNIDFASSVAALLYESSTFVPRIYCQQLDTRSFR